MTAWVTLSSDEVRAAARLVGRAPLPAFDTGWDATELGVADAVALRGLLARGLVEVVSDVDGPLVRLTAWTAAGLRPLLCPTTVVELRDEPATGWRRSVVAGALDGRVVLATECHPMLWRLRTSAGRAEDIIRPAVDARLASLGPVPPGVRPGPDLRAAVARTVTVRLASDLGGTVRAAGAVRWLDAGALGTWLAEPADEVDGGPEVLRPADAVGVRAALEDLLTEEEIGCPS